MPIIDSATGHNLFGEQWLGVVRKKDATVNKLAQSGFEFFSNAGSGDFTMTSRIAGNYGGTQYLRLANAYDSQGNPLPHSMSVWVPAAVSI